MAKPKITPIIGIILAIAIYFLTPLIADEIIISQGLRIALAIMMGIFGTFFQWVAQT